MEINQWQKLKVGDIVIDKVGIGTSTFKKLARYKILAISSLRNILEDNLYAYKAIRLSDDYETTLCLYKHYELATTTRFNLIEYD